MITVDQKIVGQFTSSELVKNHCDNLFYNKKYSFSVLDKTDKNLLAEDCMKVVDKDLLLELAIEDDTCRDILPTISTSDSRAESATRFHEALRANFIKLYTDEMIQAIDEIYLDYKNGLEIEAQIEQAEVRRMQRYNFVFDRHVLRIRPFSVFDGG